MSFILDALKKSESDRQRQSGPSLFEVKVAPPRRRLPVWAMAIAVLLGINAIVVSWMLLRHAPAQPSAAASGPAAPGAASPAALPAASPAASPGPAVAKSSAGAGPTAAPTTGPGTGAATAAATAAGAGAAVPAAGSGQPPPAASAAASGTDGAGSGAGVQAAADANPSDYAPAAEPAAAPGGADTDSAALPLYQQIAGTAGLPTLHLDLHVFASRPKDRFVMINMHRLGEGDSLPGGVHVEAIRPDGVVLSYHGTRFLLPRD